MGFFRKKPIVIEALQWDGDNYDEISAFVCPPCPLEIRNGSITDLIIPTLEGEHVASKGDWIIKGVQGECYPCKPDIFGATYEEVI